MLGEAVKVTLPLGVADEENDRTVAVQEMDVLVDATLKAVHVSPVKLGAAFTVIETVALVDAELPLSPP